MSGLSQVGGLIERALVELSVREDVWIDLPRSQPRRGQSYRAVNHVAHRLFGRGGYSLKIDVDGVLVRRKPAPVARSKP